MTMEFAVPLITGLFVGGIITEVRWVLRLRQLQGQIGLDHSAELLKAAALAETATQGTPEAQSSLGLRSLRDHLDAEGGATPAIAPVPVGKPGA
jgi:hypothetical protein